MRRCVNRSHQPATTKPHAFHSVYHRAKRLAIPLENWQLLRCVSRERGGSQRTESCQFRAVWRDASRGDRLSGMGMGFPETARRGLMTPVHATAHRLARPDRVRRDDGSPYVFSQLPCCHARGCHWHVPALPRVRSRLAHKPGAAVGHYHHQHHRLVRDRPVRRGVISPRRAVSGNPIPIPLSLSPREASRHTARKLAAFALREQGARRLTTLEANSQSTRARQSPA